MEINQRTRVKISWKRSLENKFCNRTSDARYVNVECLHRVYKLILENVALGLNAFWQNMHLIKMEVNIL